MRKFAPVILVVAAALALSLAAAPAAEAQEAVPCKNCGIMLGGGTTNKVNSYSGYPYCRLCYEEVRAAAEREARERRAQAPVRTCAACGKTIDEQRPHVVIYGGGVSNYFCDNAHANQVFSCRRCGKSLVTGFNVVTHDVDGVHYCKDCAAAVRAVGRAAASPAAPAAPAEAPAAPAAPAATDAPRRGVFSSPGFWITIGGAAAVAVGLLFAASRRG